MMCPAAYVDRAPRFPLQVPLRYRRSGIRQWQEGRTLNISRTGILFHVDEIIPANSILDMQLSFPEKIVVMCRASMVRSEQMNVAVRILRYRLTRK